MTNTRLQVALGDNCNWRYVTGTQDNDVKCSIYSTNAVDGMWLQDYRKQFPKLQFKTETVK